MSVHTPRSPCSPAALQQYHRHRPTYFDHKPHFASVEDTTATAKQHDPKPALHTPLIVTTGSHETTTPATTLPKPVLSAVPASGIPPLACNKATSTMNSTGSSRFATPHIMPPAALPTSPNFSLPPLMLPPDVDSISRNQLRDIVQSSSTLVVDVRPYAVYAVSRIVRAVNICIPSTLLKRPTFVVSRFGDCMALEQRACLDRIAEYDHIVLYDQNAPATLVSEPSIQHASLIHTMRKFCACENVTAKLLYLKGGFQDVDTAGATDLIDTTPLKSLSGTDSQQSTLNKSVDSVSDAVKQPFSLTGFAIPDVKDRTGMFLNRNAKLVPRAGEHIAMCLPEMSDEERASFPQWVRNVLEGGTTELARKFQELEDAEKNRLQVAFSGVPVSPAYRAPESPGVYSVAAGADLGNKNRYNNIWPYDHARVRVPKEECDYINASYVVSSMSDRKYIAAQGPLPSTVGDFWKVIWYEDIPVIMMLTAEYEGGHCKCYPYWKSQHVTDGLEVELLSEDEVLLNNQTKAKAVIRRLKLIHSNESKMVTQIHYSSWPDLGLPANAIDALSLVDLKNAYFDSSKATLVHCSAGCGRTGTFCTVDTVIDILQNEIIINNDTDIIFDVVRNFRRQRLLMVQSLRQFILCYESIIEWLHSRWVSRRKSA